MPDAEIEPRSGLWNGFYSQFGEEHPFSLQMNFKETTVQGVGIDEIGMYRISGDWDKHTGQVVFLKQYEGQHSVNYKGTLSGDGRSIEGMYTVSGGSGDFRMTFSSGDS